MDWVFLFPRLPIIHAGSMVKGFLEKPPQPVCTLSQLQEFSDRITYASSGGHSSAQPALEIAAELRSIAEEKCGFSASGTTEGKHSFDVAASKYLSTHQALRSGEALRDDMWTCLSTIFLPDLVNWRFDGYPLARYVGGVRNTFQRLWTRGTVLDRGEKSDQRWELVEKLSEDACVQIFERSSICGHYLLARMIAEAWVWSHEHMPHVSISEIMRQSMKIILLRSEIYDFSSLTENDLKEEIFTVFSDVAAQYGAELGKVGL